VNIPAQSPNCNPHAKRFVKTIRYECLNQFVFFGERHLGHVVKAFMAHYRAERFHQGLGGQLIKKPAGSAKENGVHGKVICRSRLGEEAEHGGWRMMPSGTWDPYGFPRSPTES
jgi:hypothetical protein